MAIMHYHSSETNNLLFFFILEIQKRRNYTFSCGTKFDLINYKIKTHGSKREYPILDQQYAAIEQVNDAVLQVQHLAAIWVDPWVLGFEKFASYVVGVSECVVCSSGTDTLYRREP